MVPDKAPGEENNKRIFYITSITFLLIFLYYAFRNGINNGFLITLFVWCVTVSTTPISTDSILLTFPIKVFTDIPLFATKTLISILSFLVVYYFYKFKQVLINTTPIGRAIVRIMDNRIYAIFGIAIIASIISSYLLDAVLDNYVIIKDNGLYTTPRVVSALTAFLMLNITYFAFLTKYNILAFNKKHYFL